MNDAEFLNWVADRFVHVYGESENVDFVRKLRSIARWMTPKQGTLVVPDELMDDFAESRLNVIRRSVWERAMGSSR